MTNISPSSVYSFGKSMNPGGLMFMPFKKLQKFQTVFNQGEPANKLFIVKSGFVKLCESSPSGDQIVHEIKSEGEIFGEWDSFFSVGTHFKYSAITLSDDTEIHYSKFPDINFNQVPHLNASFSNLILEDLKKLSLRHQKLLHQDSAYRVRETLFNLAKKAGQKFGDETLLKIWLSHEDIAKLADTSRQTVTTVMNELKNKKKITYSRDRILFRNLANFQN